VPSPNIALMQQKSKAQLKTSLRNSRVSQQTDAYLDKVCVAIGFAWDMWRMQATFRKLMIHGPIAVGTAGCLDGPLWDRFIKQKAPQANVWERTLSNAIAAAFSEAWKKYQDSITVPGLPWYPSFAAFPGSAAPPTPNIPMPLAVLGQITQSLTPAALKAKILEKAGKSTALAEPIAEAVAAGFFTAFQTWVPIQLITNVLGKGPVPSFAPPYVPMGPVVGGDNIAAPGHLLA
jgi:hypothetical protein